MTRLKVFACFYNEAALIPFFLAHYHFAGQIEAFVSKSIDATRELLSASERVIVRDVEMPRGMDDDIKIGWLNRAIAQRHPHHDWFIVVDADEFVFPPGDPGGETVEAYLSTVPHTDVALIARMVNVFRVESDRDLDPSFRPVVLQRRHGVSGRDGFNRGYQKPSVIRANRGLGYAVGQHWLNPRRAYAVKHYFEGAHWQNADPSFAITRRVRDRRDRMSDHNKRRNLGGQHHHAGEEDVRRELESHWHDDVVL